MLVLLHVDLVVSHLHVINALLLLHLHLLVHHKLTLLEILTVGVIICIGILVLFVDGVFVNVQQVDQVIQDFDARLVKILQQLLVPIYHFFHDGRHRGAQSHLCSWVF